MAITKTEERIPARMPHDVYERIVDAPGPKANNIIEMESTIHLSTQAAKKVFALLENPPQPTRQLKKSLQQRKKVLFSK